MVATMNREDASLAEKMNIDCDAIIANQAGRHGFESVTRNGRTVKMITTDTKGVGLNRNIALFAADAEIVLFADDDMVYCDGLSEGVAAAFDHWKDADVILFSVSFSKNGQVFKKRIVPQKRMRLWNSLKYGAIAVAAKRESILKNNISFSHFFGGGCIYGSGEDSMFIKHCFDKGLKVYSYDFMLGRCGKDSSTWFCGYNDKFFFDKGAALRYMFPKMKYLMMLRFALKFKESGYSYGKKLRLMADGIKKSKNLTPFEGEQK